jgi:hypothetical protein
MSTATLQPVSGFTENRPRNRDQELVRYVGRHGLVALEHVMAAMAAGRTAAYRRVAACIEAGLLERLAILREEPSLLRATVAGLRYAGLGLPVAKVSAGEVEHALRCASLARRAERHYGADRVLSERELAFAEKLEGRRIASAEVSAPRAQRLSVHRPDLAILPSPPQAQGPSRPRTQGEALGGPKREPEDAGMRRAPEPVIAIEVELTPKAPRRLQAILRGWHCAHWVSEVHYFCAPGQTFRAVERAIEKTGAADKVLLAEVPL